MTITLLNTGKTDSSLTALLDEYAIRINRFVKFTIECMVPPSNIGKLKSEDVKRIEADLLLKKLSRADCIILLDEKGKKYSSINFARFLQSVFNMGYKHLFFVSGGAYGFSPKIYEKASELLSLSDMTTTHQLVRLFFSEQLYRALTIINNHPYHND
jgi:23S rRNA (pseudouridine1915-N3)-methyltransferase